MSVELVVVGLVLAGVIGYVLYNRRNRTGTDKSVPGDGASGDGDSC